jgi:hypothetical protein
MATIHRPLTIAPGMMVKMANPRRQRIAIAADKVPQKSEVSQDGLREDIVDKS